MKFPRFTLNQWLILAVFLGLLYNTYVHYTHPAYRFYRASVLALRAEYEGFRRQIVSDFVPAITNLQFRLTSSLASSSASATNSVVGFTNPMTSPTNGFSAVRPPLRFGRYFECNGVPYVTLGVRYYTVGDEIMGYPVVSIAPGVVKLGEWYYDFSETCFQAKSSSF